MRRVPIREWILARGGASMWRMLRTTFALVAVALVAAVPAGAKRIVVRATLAPGKLRIVAAPTAVPAGAQRAIRVRVADARGNGRGWTVRLVPPRDLAVMSITARCAAGSTCTIPRALGVPKAAAVLHAAAGTGMGIIDLVVVVHANVRTTPAFTVS
jgi:hypothetical protein